LIKILIVDDQPHIRRLVRGLVEAEHDWVVCGEAANGQQATEQCALLAPDLIILDINMPVMNGFEAAKIIHMRSPEVLILILTTDSLVHFARAASKTGASGVPVQSEQRRAPCGSDCIFVECEKYFLAA
jgi:two-component system chemotaxis response regulator CheB